MSFAIRHLPSNRLLGFNFNDTGPGIGCELIVVDEVVPSLDPGRWGTREEAERAARLTKYNPRLRRIETYDHQANHET